MRRRTDVLVNRQNWSDGSMTLLNLNGLIPADAVMDQESLPKVQMLRPEQGYPLRVLIPGWEGNVSVKWLRRIKVGDQ